MANNPDITTMPSSVAQPHVVINDNSEAVDASLSEQANLLVTSTNAYTVLGSQYHKAQRFHLLEGSPAPDADIIVDLPEVKRGLTVWKNDTTQQATIAVPGGGSPGVVVAAGATVLISSDGVEVIGFAAI